MEVRRFDGSTLRYMTVEPDGYEPGGDYPLVILMHGYGSHMADAASLSGTIGAEGYLYAMPNGPIALPLGQGAVGYAWAHPSEEVEGNGVEESEERLVTFFQEVMGRYGIRPGNVVLGGFSQGGIMTYRLGLTMANLFAGLVVLSGRMEAKPTLKSRLPASRDQRIFISHGTLDTVISVQEGRVARRFLEEEGYRPHYREWPMGHEISYDVLSDLSGWIREVVPPARAAGAPTS